MAWWLKAMLEQYPGGDANRLARFFEGFGVGGEVKIYCFFGVPGVFPALENGIVEFVSMNDPWTRGDRTITVRLTRKGMEYFDSLPRIQYDLNC